eukprot:gene19715-26937_t
MLLANAMKPLPGNQPLVDAIQNHGQQVFGEAIPAVGTPLYTDVRLYVERGIPGVIYGAGPRTVRESNAKRADEHVQLEDLRRATKVIARTLPATFVANYFKVNFMGMPVRIDDTLYEQAKAHATAERRTIAGQIEFWAMVGKA